MPRTVGLSESAYGAVARHSADGGLTLTDAVSDLVLRAASLSDVEPAPVKAAGGGGAGAEVELGNEDDFVKEDDFDAEDGLDDTLGDLAARVGSLEDRADDADDERLAVGAFTAALGAGLDDHLHQHSEDRIRPLETRVLILERLRGWGVSDALLERAQGQLEAGEWPAERGAALAEADAIGRAAVNGELGDDALADTDPGDDDGSEGGEPTDGDDATGGGGGFGLLVAGLGLIALLLVGRQGMQPASAQASQSTAPDALESLVQNA